jgi:hypothetical protein
MRPEIVPVCGGWADSGAATAASAAIKRLRVRNLSISSPPFYRGEALPLFDCRDGRLIVR